MALPMLRDDALTRRGESTELRLCLPWIRSMPLWCVESLSVHLDGAPVQPVVRLGERSIDPEQLADESGWWYLQDRLVLAWSGDLRPGAHTVAVAMSLVVPYLPGGPGAPLALPFGAEQDLELLTAPARAQAARDVGSTP